MYRHSNKPLTACGRCRRGPACRYDCVCFLVVFAIFSLTLRYLLDERAQVLSVEDDGASRARSECDVMVLGSLKDEMTALRQYPRSTTNRNTSDMIDSRHSTRIHSISRLVTAEHSIFHICQAFQKLDKNNCHRSRIEVRPTRYCATKPIRARH